MANEARAEIDALRRSHDELADLVGRVGPDGLTGPSACSDWTVAQVLSHLGSAAEIGLGTLETGSNDMERAKGIWARWDAMGPSEQASGFVEADERYVSAFEAFSEQDVASRTFDLGFLPAPVGIPFMAAMRLSEVGLHLWDLEVVADPATTVPAYLVPFVLDTMANFAGFFSKPSGRTGSVSVRTSGPERAYSLTLTEEGASLDSGSASGDSTLDLPAESLSRLIAGRLAADHTPADVTVSGDITLEDLRKTFPGY